MLAACLWAVPRANLFFLNPRPSIQSLNDQTHPGWTESKPHSVHSLHRMSFSITSKEVKGVRSALTDSYRGPCAPRPHPCLLFTSAPSPCAHHPGTLPTAEKSKRRP